jgi:serine/threonine-protein kinase
MTSAEHEIQDSVTEGVTQRVDPLIGMKIGEHRILSRIGEGGMGIVYAGEQPLIGRKIAVKILQPYFARDRDAVSRFLQEARAANQIRHRNIIDIYDFGTLDDDRHYLIMEFLEGQALDLLLHEKGAFSFEEGLALLDEMADALAAAHGAGIIHRDLKPGNIFVVKQGDGTKYVKLLDFGLAKLTQTQTQAQGPTTRTGVVMGTPEYMAPEQARGEAVDARADIYALGVIAYEMFSGRPPFLGKSEIETMIKQQTDPVPPFDPARRVPADVDAVIRFMLEKDPADRPASMTVVRAEIRRLREALRGRTDPRLARTVLSGGRAAVVRAAWSRAGRAPRTRIVVVASLLGLLALLAGFFLPRGRSAPEPAAAPIREAATASIPEEPRPQPAPTTQGGEPKIAAAEAAAPVVPATAEPARLTVSANAPCEVFLDGKALGRAPIVYGVENPGAHVLKCRNVFGGEAAAQLQLEAGRAQTQELVFGSGILEFAVVPYATVTIDGKSHGDTPFEPVRLLEGTHKIELRNGEQVVARSVRLRAGQVEKIKVKMTGP